MLDSKMQSSNEKSNNNKKDYLQKSAWFLRDKLNLMLQVLQSEKVKNDFYTLDYDQLLFRATDAVDSSALQMYTQQQSYKTLLKHNQHIKQ